MFITVGIVASIAIAGYLGYKNKEQVIWNSVKLYDSIKDYCYQFQDNFKLNNIVIFNGEKYFNIDIENWKRVPFYLMGLCDVKSDEYKNSEICLSYTLYGTKYCRIYPIFPDNIEVDYMIDDIYDLKKYNENNKNNKNDHKIVHINFILSARYFDGFEDIDVTELLQMFDTNGEFYKTNNNITFEKILEWCHNANLYKLYENDSDYINKNNDRYIEIVNLFGEFKTFSTGDILKFT